MLQSSHTFSDFEYLNLRKVEVKLAFVCKDSFRANRDNERLRLRYKDVFRWAGAREGQNYHTTFIIQDIIPCWMRRNYVPLDTCSCCVLYGNDSYVSAAIARKKADFSPVQKYFYERRITML